MLAPRWHKVIRDLWHNKLRTVLVVLVISVGIFAFGLIETARATIQREATRDYLETNPASISMIVSPFSDDLVRAVRGMREVAQAEGRSISTVNMQTGQGERLTLELLAIPSIEDMSISQIELEDGMPPPGSREVLLERSLLIAMPGYDPGNAIRIELPDGQERELAVVGFAHDAAVLPTFYSLKAYGYVTFDTFNWLYDSQHYNQLNIVVAQDADDREAIEDAAALIQDRIERDGYIVVSTTIPEPGEHWGSGEISGILAGMNVLGGFVLLFCSLLIINTISAMLKRQVRQIGMMKAIGAQTRQVVGIYLIMVMILGLLSLLLAVPLGMLGGWGLSAFTARMMNFDLESLRMEPSAVLIQIVLAIVVPPLAALIPILSGTRVTVGEALRDYGISQTSAKRGLMARLIERVRGLPRPLMLSLRNTFRRRGRLTLTLIVLTLAGGIFIAIFSMRDSGMIEIERAFDLFGYDLGITLSEPGSAHLMEREALRVAGVVGAEAWNVTEAHFVLANGAEGDVIIYAAPPDTDYIDPEPNLIVGRWLQVGEQNTIVVMDNLIAAEPGDALGEEIRLELGGREATWEIVGVVTQLTVGDETGFAYVGDESYARATGMTGMANHVVIETAHDDIDMQLCILRAVEEQFQNSGVAIASSQSIAQFLASTKSFTDIMLGITVFMAILMAIVGGLGLSGTLSLSVIERVREIGVMRAIGASNRSVWGIVVVEGIFIGVVSALMGAIIAIPIAKLLLDAFGSAFGGKSAPFSYSLPGFGIWLVISIVVSALASFLPARNASRISVREALTYE
jgi:putative ABC transport system permease protein